jgi:hypothetical protein
MRQTERTLQEQATNASPADVLAEAKRFFGRQNGIYSAFPEQESERHLTLRGQGGEEIAIGVQPKPGGGTIVSASTYLFDQQVARFLAMLPPADASPPPPGAVG